MTNFKSCLLLVLLLNVFQLPLAAQGYYGVPNAPEGVEKETVVPLTPAEAKEELRKKIQLLVEVEFLYPKDKEVLNAINAIRTHSGKWRMYLRTVSYTHLTLPTIYSV